MKRRGMRWCTLAGDKEAENCSRLSGAVPTSRSSPPSRYMPPHAVRSDELTGREQRPPQDGRPGDEAVAGKATSRDSGLVRASVVVMPPCPSGTMEPPAMWSGMLSVTPACSCQQQIDHAIALVTAHGLSPWTHSLLHRSTSPPETRMSGCTRLGYQRNHRCRRLWS